MLDNKTTSPTGPLLDTTNSVLKLSPCGSDDTIILDEDYSRPSIKRQKAYKDDKHVCCLL